MPLVIPADVRAKAEIYVGDAAGQEKTRFMLQETGLPSGILPLRDIIECGYVEETGFVWLKQKAKVSHYFAGAGRHVTYGTEVSAIAEPGRLRKITGVKAREMLMWVTLHEIGLDAKDTKKLVCKAIGGISRTFPAEAFEADSKLAPPADGDGPDAVIGSPPDDDEEEVVAGPEEEAGEKKEETATAGEAAEKETAGADGEKKEDAAAAVDGVEKIKELGTEAVAAKN